MFYITESFYRFFYLLYSFILTGITFFFFKEELVFFCLLPTTKSFYSIDYLLFTNPSEIFVFVFSLDLLFTLIFILPFLAWSVLDFFKTGFYLTEWKSLLHFSVLYACFTSLLNMFFYFFLIPLMWNFFISFIKKDLILVDFFLELKAFEYFLFLFNLLSILNFCSIFLFFFFYLFFYKLKDFLKYKLYLYTVFLLFATLCTPPDLLSQVFLFLFLVIFFEILLFLILYYHVYKKLILFGAFSTPFSYI